MYGLASTWGRKEGFFSFWIWTFLFLYFFALFLLFFFDEELGHRLCNGTVKNRIPKKSVHGVATMRCSLKANYLGQWSKRFTWAQGQPGHILRWCLENNLIMSALYGLLTSLCTAPGCLCPNGMHSWDGGAVHRHSWASKGVHSWDGGAVHLKGEHRMRLWASGPLTQSWEPWSSASRESLGLVG